MMRIASLVPSATEMLFALGLGDSVVAVTHECDYPPDAERLPKLTSSVIPEGLSAAEIDTAVREHTGRGEALYELDHHVLRELEVDLIVTQAVCEVCAVSFDDVRAIAEELPNQPQVISLDPSTLGEVLADIPRLAEAARAWEAGDRLAAEAASRIDAVRDAVQGAERPRVAALEWLDPVYVGGHWVPQMVDMAGGEDVLGMPGERSRVAEWAEVEAARPEIVVSMPCGYYAERAAKETMEQSERLAALEARVIAVDAAAYFSRPGPRLVDGIEWLGHLFHPDRVEQPSDGTAITLDLSPRARVS
jgi:iron complex transport system substrate-binding protein